MFVTLSICTKLAIESFIPEAVVTAELEPGGQTKGIGHTPRFWGVIRSLEDDRAAQAEQQAGQYRWAEKAVRVHQELLTDDVFPANMLMKTAEAVLWHML
jgi:hypothetical protein